MFWCFHSVWVHLGLFRYCSNIGAKRAEQVQLKQKFMQRSRVGILHNEHTRSTQLDPKLMFWCFRSVWVHLGLFRYCSNISAERAEQVQLMQKFMQRSCVVIFRNECTRSTPLDPKLMFQCVSQRLGAFGTVSLLLEALCKSGRIGAINAKVRAMKWHQNSSQRTHPIYTIGP